jgi:hypothetical protein
MKPVHRFQGLSYLLRCRALFQSVSCLILLCMLGNLAILDPVWAQDNNVVRIALASQPGAQEDTVYFLSLDGNALGQGQPALLKGVLQRQNETIPLELEIPYDELNSITLSPNPPTGPHKKKTYAIYQDGVRTSYQLVMTTFVDDLKPNTLLHSGTIVDTSTGTSVNFVALNDPVPVLVIVAGIAAIVCVISILVADCGDQAAAACGEAGVKWAHLSVSVSLWEGCTTECTWECNPPPATPVPTAPPATPVPKQH